MAESVQKLGKERHIDGHHPPKCLIAEIQMPTYTKNQKFLKYENKIAL
jgi:hypothetical protein